RRRHTRCLSDWSSDVCSSDLSFRSVVIALKAILLNLLSVGAAYGVLVAVFQWGWGASLLGFQTNGGIAQWLPIFMFVILFGLSKIGRASCRERGWGEGGAASV